MKRLIAPPGVTRAGDRFDPHTRQPSVQFDDVLMGVRPRLLEDTADRIERRER